MTSSIVKSYWQVGVINWWLLATVGMQVKWQKQLTSQSDRM